MRGGTLKMTGAVSDRSDRVTAPMRSSRHGLPDQRRDVDHRNDALLETIRVHVDDHSLLLSSPFSTFIGQPLTAPMRSSRRGLPDQGRDGTS